MYIGSRLVREAVAEAAGESTTHPTELTATRNQGWVNDPNGIGRWDGRWHVLFQYNHHG